MPASALASDPQSKEPWVPAPSAALDNETMNHADLDAIIKGIAPVLQEQIAKGFVAEKFAVLEKFASMETRVAVLETKIAAPENKTAGLEAKIGALEAKLARLDAAYTHLAAEHAELKATAVSFGGPYSRGVAYRKNCLCLFRGTLWLS